jgi:PKHD-type hydroxylase
MSLPDNAFLGGIDHERWAYVGNAFSPEEIAEIIRIGESGDGSTGLSSGEINFGSIHAHDTNVRRSSVSWLDIDAPSNKWIMDRLWSIGGAANDIYFKYAVDHIQSVQFTKYDSGGEFYGKHLDMENHGPVRRKFSVSIQLSDGQDYDGGDLIFHTDDTPIIVPKQLGFAAVFPSFMLHEVTPVTRGTRYSLVSWGCGPEFK